VQVFEEGDPSYSDSAKNDGFCRFPDEQALP
jgi:hypothetical protein